MTSKNVFKFVVTLALVFAIAGAFGVFTAKASHKSFSSATHLMAPRTASAKETLKKSVFVTGSSGAALPVGTFTTIDGATLGCPGSGTCTYETENHLQIDASATSNWALLTTLDGSFIGDGGPYLGPVGTDYSAGSWSDVSTPVGAGSHALQTQAYMRDNAGTAFNYSFNYRVYKP
jgi:hypothetical protein